MIDEILDNMTLIVVTRFKVTSKDFCIVRNINILN